MPHPHEGAAALRELLRLYAASADAGARRQVDGIRSVAVARVVRRLPGPGPLAFGRGLEITVTVDEMAFEGASAFLLGAVLSAYFARHVSINSFTETVLAPTSRGEINDGCHNGARGRRCSASSRSSREAPYRARLLSDAAPARVPVRRQAALGEALRPADEPVRLGQDPELAFAPAPLSSARAGRDGRAAAPAGAALRPARAERPAAAARHRVRARAAAPRRRPDARAGSSTSSITGSSRFLPGMGAGAAARQPRSARRTIASPPTSGAFVGIGAAGPAAPGCRAGRGQAAFTSGRSSARCGTPRGSSRSCSTIFRVPVRVEEFVGHWMRARAARAHLPGARGGHAGRGAVLGGRVWDRQHKFRMRLGPLTLDEYESFLPGGAAAAQAGGLGAVLLSASSSSGMCGCELDRREVPRVTLGGRAGSGGPRGSAHRRSERRRRRPVPERRSRSLGDRE